VSFSMIARGVVCGVGEAPMRFVWGNRIMVGGGAAPP
jgi:hypothetical protein